MEIIDQEIAQRWNIGEYEGLHQMRVEWRLNVHATEIGDVLGHEVATSKVILPGPLPVSTTIPTPQAPTTGPQEATAVPLLEDVPQQASEQPAQQ
jgi:hypothetical protein